MPKNDRKGQGYVGFQVEYLHVYGCYFGDETRINRGQKFIVVGDFNVKSLACGSPRRCSREQLLEEFFVEQELEVINEGAPTFIRGNS